MESRKENPKKPFKEIDKILLILIVALINGLIFTYLMPPWQHYDEPGHFEYAWLAANRKGLPQVGDDEPSLNRVILESMIRNDFFKDSPNPPTIESLTDPVPFPALKQLGDPPLYYLIASIPLRLTRSFKIEIQLYAARLVSLVLFLVVVFISWLITVELTPENHPLRWMVPLSIAFLPGFVDVMTSVNNDVGAVVLYSLFLWLSVRLIKNGLSVAGVIGLILTAVAAYFTRNTIYVAILFVPVVLVLSAFRGSNSKYAWGLLAASFLLLLLASFTLRDPAHWLKNTLQSNPIRSFDANAPVGRYVLGLETDPVNQLEGSIFLNQHLREFESEDLGGKTITVGAWIWADDIVDALIPEFNTFATAMKYSEVVQVNQEPTFFTYHYSMPNTLIRNWISLTTNAEEEIIPTTIYYDGIILLEGEWPLDEVPEFNDADGSSGIWGGRPFKNLIKNASFETPWISFKTWVDRIGSGILPSKNTPSIVLYFFYDFRISDIAYQVTFLRIFRTFWGLFGWAHVNLLGNSPYRNLAILSLVGFIGSLFAIWRVRLLLNWKIVFLFFISMLVVYLITITREAHYFFHIGKVYVPVARYAYPVIIPTMIVLNLGWLEIARLLHIKLHIPGFVYKVLFITFFIGLDLWSIYSITRFYS